MFKQMLGVFLAEIGTYILGAGSHLFARDMIFSFLEKRENFKSGD